MSDTNLFFQHHYVRIAELGWQQYVLGTPLRSIPFGSSAVSDEEVANFSFRIGNNVVLRISCRKMSTKNNSFSGSVAADVEVDLQEMSTIPRSQHRVSGSIEEASLNSDDIGTDTKSRNRCG